MSEVRQPKPASARGVVDIQAAADGSIWFATPGGWRYESAPITAFTRADGLPANNTRGIGFDSEGVLSVGCFTGTEAPIQGGIWRFDGKQSSVRIPRAGSKETVSFTSFRGAMARCGCRFMVSESCVIEPATEARSA